MHKKRDIKEGRNTSRGKCNFINNQKVLSMEKTPRWAVPTTQSLLVAIRFYESWFMVKSQGRSPVASILWLVASCGVRFADGLDGLNNLFFVDVTENCRELSY